MNKLNVKAIFKSIDGEANGFGTMGELSTFVRLAGCNLQCLHCDTPQAQKSSSGTVMGVGEVCDVIYDCNKGESSKITITGGEPFEQIEGVNNLIYELLHGNKVNYRISIETNGVYSLGTLGYRKENDIVRIVMDYKGESLINLKAGEYDTRSINMKNLLEVDVIKFVIGCEEDYKHACNVVRFTKAQKVLSPVHGVVDPRDLVEWMILDNLSNIRMQIQLHKYIWPECVGTEVER